LVPSLARPAGNVTGITVTTGYEIYGKYLQILKEAVPSASNIVLLDMDTGADRQQRREALEKASRGLEISLTDMLLQQSTPSEYQRVFAEIAQRKPNAIMVSGIISSIPSGGSLASTGGSKGGPESCSLTLSDACLKTVQAWRGRHCQRNPELSLIEIRDDPQT
jgi:hypothetical protein